VGKAYLSDPNLDAETRAKAEKEYFAELWIGDHPNGPAEIHITDNQQLY